MGKGKSKADGNEVRTWWKDPKKLKTYCDLSTTQVLDGKKLQGFLIKEGVDAMIKQLGEIGKVVTHTQFQTKTVNKLDCFKGIHFLVN